MRHASSRALCALERALRSTLAQTQRRRFSYGLSVRSASSNLRHVDVALGFLAGEIYCCGQTGCEIPYHRRAWWRSLRRNLAREGLLLARHGLVLHVAEVTEVGARFPVAGADYQAAFSFREARWVEADALD